mgnify:CR=1 FL=1
MSADTPFMFPPDAGRPDADALYLELDGWEGPLDLLLDLARRQKVDLRRLSILDLVDQYLPPKAYPDAWNTEGLLAACREKLNLDAPIAQWAAEEGVDQDAMKERLEAFAAESMAAKTEAFGAETMRSIEKQILLQTIDAKWREHLLRLEHLRSVVGFRGYAQRDPLNEYKTEAFTLFESMLNGLRQDVTQKLAQVRPMTQAEQDACLGRDDWPQRVAARWCAKEAVAKALGGGMSWTDVEILNHPSGQPYVTLHGRAAPLAGTGSVHSSLTHTATQAAAIAIFVDAR